MIALPVTFVPLEIKAPPPPPQGAVAVGSFVDHLGATATSGFSAVHNFASSTALTTSLPLHKLIAKNDNASNGTSPPPPANPPTLAPQQNNPVPVNVANANQGNSGNGYAGNSNASTTGASSVPTAAALPALAPTTTIGQVQLAAALGTGATILLGAPAPTSFNASPAATGGSSNNPSGGAQTNAAAPLAPTPAAA